MSDHNKDALWPVDDRMAIDIPDDQAEREAAARHAELDIWLGPCGVPDCPGVDLSTALAAHRLNHERAPARGGKTQVGRARVAA